MKKLILAVAVLTAVAFAFGAMAAQQKAAPPAKPAPVAEAWNVAQGVIEKIDAAAKTFEAKTKVKVKGKKAMEEKMITIATDGKTKFFTVMKEKEKKLAFADLKTGMNVSVIYKVEAGKNIAKSVKVAEQQAAPKK
jgi:hypothetical protein